MKIQRLLRYQFVILILLVFGLQSMHAQEDDFQIWGDLSGKYKINKDLKLNAELGIRSRENSELLKQFYIEFGAIYEVSKRINIGFKYRFNDYFYQSKISSNRINLDIAYSFKKWGRTKWSIRERYQYEWLSNAALNNYDDINLRSKLKVSYDIRKTKIEPFFAMEHYLGLNGEYIGLTSQMRWTLGAETKVNKWSDISAAFRIKREFNTANPLTAYIFMISYKVDLN